MGSGGGEQTAKHSAVSNWPGYEGGQRWPQIGVGRDLETAKKHRERAAEFLRIAGRSKDAGTRRMLMAAAITYYRLASQLEEATYPETKRDE